jgi:transcription elongation factor GreA
MAEEKNNVFTSDGFKRLQDELSERKTTVTAEITARLEEARGQGDLSENSEYDDAKNEQAFLEGEIQDLEAKIRNSDIIKAGSGDVVQMGSRVSVVDLEFAEDGPETFMIVGSTEADPDEGKISNESPLGQALLGQKVGAVVDVHAPAGIIKYEIKEILS